MGRLGQSIHPLRGVHRRGRAPRAHPRSPRFGAQAEIALRGVADAEERQRLRRIIRARRRELPLRRADPRSRRGSPSAARRWERTELDLVALVPPSGRHAGAGWRRDARHRAPRRRAAGPASPATRVLLDSALRNVLGQRDQVLARGHDRPPARRGRRGARPGLGPGRRPRSRGGAARASDRALPARGTPPAASSARGLGLTIASDVLSAHGGRLELARGPDGRGACVTLVLPSA